MSLTILNNISSLSAENALSNTQASLQKTLTQLSTGLRINSGSDDAAGLSIATGMQANIAALTQSQQNASNGIGMLQTADGALSQVTTLLNRAVTLATEASTSGITTGTNSQATALDGEFQSIMSEITQIGQTTDFNGQNVFNSNTPTTFTSTQASLTTGTALSAGTVDISDATTGGTFVFTASTSTKVSDLQAAITSAVSAGTLSAGTSATLSSGQLVIGPNSGSTGISVTSNVAVLGTMNADPTTNNTNTVYLGDGVVTGAAKTQITTTINALSATSLNLNSNVPDQRLLCANRTDSGHSGHQPDLRTARRHWRLGQPSDGGQQQHEQRRHQPAKRNRQHRECRHRQDRCQHDPVQRAPVHRHGSPATVQPGPAGCVEAGPVT